MKVMRVWVDGKWYVLLEDGSLWQLDSAVVQQMTDEEYDTLTVFLVRLTRHLTTDVQELKLNGFFQAKVLYTQPTSDDSADPR